MSNIAKAVGQRIRNYRIQSKLTQEQLADLAGCHPTYIGQIERGEKNATLDSIEKVANALHVPLSQLFEHLNGDPTQRSIPLECYEWLSCKSVQEQERIYNILMELDKFKNG